VLLFQVSQAKEALYVNCTHFAVELYLHGPDFVIELLQAFKADKKMFVYFFESTFECVCVLGFKVSGMKAVSPM
jgi:hypothetical protein